MGGEILMEFTEITTELNNYLFIIPLLCENILGREDYTRKDWISDSTWQMIERRKQVKGKLCATYARIRKGKELEKEYAVLNKEIKTPEETIELMRIGLQMKLR